MFLEVTESKKNSLVYIENNQGRLNSIIGSGQSSTLEPLPAPPLTGIKNVNGR